jgi:MoxR-like ATPase
MSRSDIDVAKLNEAVREEALLVQAAVDEIRKVIVGQKALVERMMVALLCRGHLLVEGVPGLAKTLAVKTLGQVLDLRFARIQFTPDLLPADLVGTMVYQQKTGEFVARTGPVFTNLLLADEINRAPAKVQSALLESMQERQVTLGDATHALPDPFLVFATQNPIEQEGTYPLPEAQLDRFMFQVDVDYPSASEEEEIVRMSTSGYAARLERVLSPERVLELQELVLRVPAADHVVRYAVALARATRPQEAVAPPFVREYVQWGAGPRASQFLVLAGKARAILDGRFAVSIDDVAALARPTLQHRLILNYRAEAEGVRPGDLVDRLLGVVAP